MQLYVVHSPLVSFIYHCVQNNQGIIDLRKICLTFDDACIFVVRMCVPRFSVAPNCDQGSVFLQIKPVQADKTDLFIDDALHAQRLQIKFILPLAVIDHVVRNFVRIITS